MQTLLSLVSTGLVAALGSGSAGCGSVGVDDSLDAVAQDQPRSCALLDASLSPASTDAGVAPTVAPDGPTTDAAVAHPSEGAPVPSFVSIGSACSLADTTMSRSVDGLTLTIRFGRFAAQRGQGAGTELENCLMRLPLASGARTYALERIAVRGQAQLSEGTRSELLFSPSFTGTGGLVVDGRRVDRRFTIDGPHDGSFALESTLEGPELQFIPCQPRASRNAEVSASVFLGKASAGTPSPAIVEVDTLSLQYRAKDCHDAAPVL